MNVAPPTVLTDRMRAFLAAPNYASLATVGDDGEPHQAISWYRLDADDRILVNSRMPRRWPAELIRNGRCSLAVIATDDPFTWVGLQVELDAVIEDVEAAREDIVALAVRYGEDDDESVARFRSQPRISFQLRIVAAHDHLDE